jgi:hypothetical protein
MLMRSGEGLDYPTSSQSLPPAASATPLGAPSALQRSVSAFAPLSRARRDVICDTCDTLATPSLARSRNGGGSGFLPILGQAAATPIIGNCETARPNFIWVSQGLARLATTEMRGVAQ